MKHISILGSTGSIGVNTLEIVRMHPDKFSVKALAAFKRADELYEQAREFRPEVVCLYSEDHVGDLESKLKSLGIRLVTGPEGLVEASTLPSVDQVIVAIVGAIGLAPIFAALQAGKSLGIANKEPLVIAGELLMKESKRLNVPIYPIDSEHSGLWQCLEGRKPESVKKMILTSSGGPFRNFEGSLESVTPEQALNHPKWKMGPKITIDSATLMNKGLEVIEAANLFGVSCEKVEVLVHPEAIVHAMVEFVDGSVISQLGVTDMKLPIQYAMSYPERIENGIPSLDFAELKSLHFEKPDLERFPCLRLGYEASRLGGTMPAVLNAANEIAVQAFLDEKIAFLEIPKMIENTMKKHRLIESPLLDQLLEADVWAREEAQSMIKGVVEKVTSIS